VDDPDSWLLIAFFFCLALAAFFSGAEAAFLALPKLRIRYLQENGVKGAEHLANASKRPGKFLATVLLGNNLVNVAAATLGSVVAVALFGLPWGPIIATIVVTILILVFGEVIPKTIAVHYAQRLSLFYITPITLLQWILFPIIWILERIGLGFTKMVTETDEKLVTEGEIRSAINVGEDEGVVQENEAKMLHKIFEFTDRQVGKIMIPRTEIAWIEQGTKVNNFLAAYADEIPYSRFPVYRDNTDNVVGILYVKDIVLQMAIGAKNEEWLIDDLIRPAYFVPESKRLGELLTEMRDSGNQMAIIIDEFGGVAGMVTLSQLTEEIVGDMRHELTEGDEDFIATGDNTFQLDGGFHIEEANIELALNLPEGDYETVAGFIFSHLGRIPTQGEQFKYRDLKFVITEIQGVKIEKVIVTKERDAASTS
jgi:putative hemolysin